jgi:hypothetical protein
MRRDPESSPWFYGPIWLCALIFAALVVTQWVTDYAAQHDASAQVAR